MIHNVLRLISAASCIISAVDSAKRIDGACLLQVAPRLERRTQQPAVKIRDSPMPEPFFFIQRDRGHSPDDSAIEQVLVLTTVGKSNQKRVDQLLESLKHPVVDKRECDPEQSGYMQSLACELMKSMRPKHSELHIDVVTGVDKSQYETEAQEMEQTAIPMSRKQRKEWMNTTFGFGPIHKGKQPDGVPSSGAMACALGHRRMWELSKNATEGKWTVILEDDAKPVQMQTLQDRLEKILKLSSGEGASEVFLDDRHCRSFGGHRGKVAGHDLNLYAMGSTAYAITAEGARALLAEPFSYGADHWLNVPVRSGAITAYCPDMPLFLHEYKHKSTI